MYFQHLPAVYATSTHPYHCSLLLLEVNHLSTPLLLITSPHITQPHSMVLHLCQSPAKPLFRGVCLILGRLGGVVLSMIWLGNSIPGSLAPHEIGNIEYGQLPLAPHLPDHQI